MEVTPEPTPSLASDTMPKSSRQIRDLGKYKTPRTRRQYAIIAKGFETQELSIAEHTLRIARLEEEVAHLKRGKKRKAIPNPNRRFVALAEALVSDKAVLKVGDKEMFVVMDTDSEEEVVSEMEAASEAEMRLTPESPQVTTRSGRIVKQPRH